MIWVFHTLISLISKSFRWILPKPVKWQLTSDLSITIIRSLSSISMSSISLSDDADIIQTRSLYARSNMIIRKFTSASLSTKIMLFNVFCTPIYGVHFCVRCISTPIVNWMLHIMMPLDSYCKNLDGAVHLNFLWPIMCLHLLPIFVNWCILCGDPWMLRTVFLLLLHYALIFSLDPLF